MIAFSTDSKMFATVGNENCIKVWDVAAGSESFTLNAHNDRIFAIRFSADGKTLVSGSRDQTLRLWNTRTGEMITSRTFDTPIGNAAFSPSGNELAVTPARMTSEGRFAGRVRVLALPSLEQKLQIDGHADEIFDLAYSHDGKTLATCAAADNVIRLWDAQSGEERGTLTGHEAWVRSLEFSRDGRTLASIDHDGGVRLWEAHFDSDIAGPLPKRDSERLPIDAPREPAHILRGHTGGVSDVVFSPDGRLLASAGSDRLIRIWDTSTWTQHASLSGHTATVEYVCLSPDGRTLASMGDLGEIIVWDVSTKRPVSIVGDNNRRFRAMSWSPNGRHLIASDYPVGTIHQWDPMTKDLRPALGLSEHGHFACGFSPDSRRLATLFKRFPSRFELRVLTVSDWRMNGRARLYAQLLMAAFSPDGCTIATCTDDRDEPIVLWDANDLRPLRSLRGHIDLVLRVAFSPNGKLLASCGADQRICLWDPATGQLVWTLNVPGGQVSGVAFSPDNRWLAAACGDHLVRVWTVSSLTAGSQ
jgi:WD40 repeat protein